MNWVFDVALSLFILFLVLVIFYIKKKRDERRARERLADEEFWRQKKAEEDREKEREAYLEPKPKVLPPFAADLQKEAEGASWEEDEEAEVEEEEKPRRIKSINVDLRNFFYKRKALNEDEVEYLLRQGYQKFSYKSICTQKREEYILKPRFNESLNHMIVIYDLAEYLDTKFVDYSMFMTRMPDLVLNFKRRKVAFEVETGTVMSNMKKFREKLKLLKKNYGDDWYFIVTNRNKVKQYQKYGKVIDPRYLKGQVDKIINNARK